MAINTLSVTYTLFTGPSAEESRSTGREIQDSGRYHPRAPCYAYPSLSSHRNPTLPLRLLLYFDGPVLLQGMLILKTGSDKLVHYKVHNGCEFKL